MKLIKIDGDDGVVESGGIRRNAKISFIKDPRVGDYLLVHAGFAMEKVRPKEAKKTLRILEEIR